jgi:parvulin-like peptidyl-prolyl isomerase
MNPRERFALSRGFRWRHKQGRWGALVLMGLLAVLQGCQGRPAGQEALVRAWGESLISKKEFSAVLSERAPECKGSSEPHCVEIRRHLLTTAIEEAILIRRAEQGGIAVSQGEIEEAESQLLADYRGAAEGVGQARQRSAWGRQAIRDRLLVRRFLEVLLQGVLVEDGEVVALFKERRELFVRPREVMVRQILVDTWEEAVDIQRRIRKGEEFSRLARARSMGPEAQAGGHLGYVRPGQLPPEIEEVVFALDEGEVSEVIPSAYGFHILKVEEKKGARELTFSEVQEELRERLSLQKAQRAYKAWMEEQWRGAQIEVLDPALAPLVEGGAKRS